MEKETPPPQLIAIYRAENAGDPMRSMQQVRALQGKGLEGDRYAEGRGIFQKPGGREAIRHVSLITQEAIEAVNAKSASESERAIQFQASDTRRNLITVGIDLSDLVGKKFKIGKVEMRGIELCTPCKRPSQLSGKEGFKAAFENRGGLRAEILDDGLLTVGDVIITNITRPENFERVLKQMKSLSKSSKAYQDGIATYSEFAQGRSVIRGIDIATTRAVSFSQWTNADFQALIDELKEDLH